MDADRPLVVAGLEGLAPDHGPLFAVVGAFDGLHRGHRYLLGQLRREAKRRGARAAVITFDHHPDEVIRGAAPPLLCDPQERLVRFAAAGVEVVIVVHFDLRLRTTEYDAFVATIRERTSLAGLLVTPETAFGYQRRGTAEALVRLGRQTGFDVVVVPPYTIDGRPVSSSEVRAAIAAGDLSRARYLLGRAPAVVGETDGQGPEAILRFPWPVALPPAGRYRTTVEAAWRLGQERGRAARRTVAVDGGTVWLARLPSTAAGWLRAAFHAPI
jgi:riboflavin kinase/FMN adenylyltransferase